MLFCSFRASLTVSPGLDEDFCIETVQGQDFFRIVLCGINPFGHLNLILDCGNLLRGVRWRRQETRCVNSLCIYAAVLVEPYLECIIAPICFVSLNSKYEISESCQNDPIGK